MSRERLFQFYEDGADSFLKKPASINSVIVKIAFQLKPQCEADALVKEGREHIVCNRFEEALEIAESVLNRWSCNAAAMVILGDAKKGLAMREEALKAYKKAELNSTDYLEPLQKIVEFHDEDGDKDAALKYLGKLDRMSPLNCNRKIQIAERHFEQGNAVEAEKYFDNAIEAAKEEALGVIGEMSLDIAESASRFDPKLAAKYYRRSLEMVKSSKSALTMSRVQPAGHFPAQAGAVGRGHRGLFRGRQVLARRREHPVQHRARLRGGPAVRGRRRPHDHGHHHQP